MSFAPGEKIRLHDGRTFRVRKDGSLPRMRRAHPHERLSTVRGFVRGELVDCVSGEKQTGDWHENVITTIGHGYIVRNYAGLASSGTSTAAGNITDLALARYWGIGYHTQTNSANFSTQSQIDNLEYALVSSNYTTNATAAGYSRVAVSAGSQCLSGTWTLSQSYQYASSQISHAVTVNCIAQHHNVSLAAGTAGPAHSLATFASSTKGTTQALNVTYNFVFST